MNVHGYYQTYAKQAGYEPKQGGMAEPGENPLDRWIWAMTYGFGEQHHGVLNEYDTVWASHRIQEFIDDLSTWYLRRSRRRKDPEFFGTLRHVLLMVSKVIAPLMPYISEKIYQDLNRRADVSSSAFGRLAGIQGHE